MAINEVFTNPTVKQVVFQIRYPNLFFLENKIGDFQLKIMKEFPNSSLLFKRQILLADLAGEAALKDIANQNQWESPRKIWQFKSDKNYSLNVQIDSIDISSNFHKTYNNAASKDKFRDVIELCVNAFLEITGIPLITRIGLRYIDECPLPSEKKTDEFEKYFNTTFPLKRFPLENSDIYEFKVESKRNGHTIRFIESINYNSKSPKLNLDFDGFSQNIESKNYLAVTDELHEIIGEEFQNSIKEPIYQHMRKFNGH